MTSLILSTQQIHELQKSGQCVTVKVLKEQPDRPFKGPEIYHPVVIRKGEEEPGEPVLGIYTDDGEWGFKSPHQPGEQRWVKETWQDYCPVWHGAWCGCGSQEMIERTHKPAYKATINERGEPKRWKASTTMPRWASRFTVTCTAVTCEQREGKWCWLTTWKLNEK